MKKVLRNEEGFTLIEIIAVLVILGVLAAVAVPKYLDLMEESRKKSSEGALAAAVSNVNMQYGANFMSLGPGDGSEAAALSQAVVDCNGNYTTVGDFSASYALQGTTGVYVEAWPEGEGQTSGYTVSGSWSVYYSN